MAQLDIDLDFADKLVDLTPEELALELYALLEACDFSYLVFTEATRLEMTDLEKHAIYQLALHGYADRWRNQGSHPTDLADRILRWRVILA